ncbi:acetyltransferase (GNAT) family protein [Thermoflavifilum aggregans]|uniref:Acetyltransferase (GNAT) family protein n=1 Tax=Thermoflavifilum aggregans TaxID=454188 RepID=A0A2M9CX00_9BACT|nr:GNAT family N-acetyltransferase [Thermoflavifilum aggregans]PJJ76410.1 acetyltransferase (GNAT) family protein [Thermoflavifilum aggregans]
MPTLQLLDAADINPRLWDACICQASNSRSYAYFHYLNAMADRWKALVTDDYQLVMPLPFKQKWGIHYVYRPPFTQQLGIFANNSLCDESVRKECYEKALQLFPYLHYSIDAGSLISLPNLQATAQPNYVLDLSQPYEIICSQYHPSLIRSLKKARHAGLQLQETSLEQAIEWYYAWYHRRIPELKKKDYHRILHASQHTAYYQIHAHQVIDQSGKPLAIAVWLCTSRRRIAILNGCHDKGRRLNAMHFLFDEIIRQSCHTSCMLDFEGSTLPGVARFIRSFGASTETYFTLHANRLPIPFRWMKK